MTYVARRHRNKAARQSSRLVIEEQIRDVPRRVILPAATNDPCWLCIEYNYHDPNMDQDFDPDIHDNWFDVYDGSTLSVYVWMPSEEMAKKLSKDDAFIQSVAITYGDKHLQRHKNYADYKIQGVGFVNVCSDHTFSIEKGLFEHVKVDESMLSSMDIYTD